jgi:4,5-dihydroxyphthalate decarboxylase
VTKLRLALAIGDYDHVADLAQGRIAVEGVDLICLTLPPEEVMLRFSAFREWEVSEMSMGRYVAMLSQNDRSVVGIPIFPSRIFRHSSLFVRRSGLVKAPSDLAGRRVGIPEWAQTAAVYSRGFLQHQYCVDLTSIDWVQAGVNQPGRKEAMTLKLPPGIGVTRVGDKSLSDMLVSGEVDAVLSAHPPACFEHEHPDIMRLFENYEEIETAYYKETGIYPIMHVVAIRRDSYEANPWIALHLFDAFEKAKKRCLERAADTTALRLGLPWSHAAAERARRVFGKDYLPYGIAPNLRTLEAFLRFAQEQGVCHRPVAVEELFPQQFSTTFKI